jgi:predicted N-acetyltransferase YhbS
MAVISGVGVRRYYERWGYILADTYQVKVLVDTAKWLRVAAATAAVAAAVTFSVVFSSRHSRVRARY